MSQERLQRFLARSGVASRRASEQLIVQGRVRVNGRPVSVLGTLIDSDHDRVDVDHHPVEPPSVYVYLALNKPVGVVSTAHDPQGRPTVVNLVNHPARIFPVGRLDTDSEGLILLTNDGDLTMRLTHPRFGIEKEYRALVRGPVDRRVTAQLSRGIVLDGQITAPARFEIDGHEGGDTWLRVTLHEGRNRQIRRMVDAVGLQVYRLMRVRIGTLRLGRLAIGDSRVLSDNEVKSLSGEAV